MDKTNNNNQAANTTPEAGGKTFTQEDVNRIVGERLAKEKSKGDAAIAEREQQIAERERQLANREALLDLKDQLKEMGLPAELLPVLNVSDKEALTAALDALNSYITDRVKNKDKNLKVYEPNKLPDGNHDTEDSTTEKLRKAMHLS